MRPFAFMGCADADVRASIFLWCCCLYGFLPIDVSDYSLQSGVCERSDKELGRVAGC